MSPTTGLFGVIVILDITGAVPLPLLFPLVLFPLFAGVICSNNSLLWIVGVGVNPVDIDWIKSSSINANEAFFTMYERVSEYLFEFGLIVVF